MAAIVARIRLQRGVENRDAVAFGGFDDGRRAVRRPDHDDGMGDFDLRFERRPQRTRREYAAVADAAAAIDQQDGEIFVQRRILKAVVHDDHGGAVLPRGFRARDAIARHDGGGKASQQQRLIADGGGGVSRRIDTHRSGQASAIAARQEKRPFVRGEKKSSDLQRCGSFAGAADRQVAEADHRHAGAPPSRAHARRCRHAVDGADGAEPPPATVRIPPEGRFAHQSLVRLPSA